MKRCSNWMIVLGLVALTAMASVAGIAEAKGNKGAKADKVRGKIVSVSATSITIQPAAKKSKNDPTAVATPPAQVTLTIPAGCTVTLNGQPATTAQLVTGDKVEVSGASTGTATDIKAKSGKGKGKKAKNNA